MVWGSSFTTTQPTFVVRLVCPWCCYCLIVCGRLRLDLWDGVGERGGDVVGFLVYYYPAHFRSQTGVPLVLLLFDSFVEGFG